MSEPKYYRKMLLRRLIYVRNQTVSYFDSMTGFGVRRDKAALFQWVKVPPG